MEEGREKEEKEGEEYQRRIEEEKSQKREEAREEGEEGEEREAIFSETGVDQDGTPLPDEKELEKTKVKGEEKEGAVYEAEEGDFGEGRGEEEEGIEGEGIGGERGEREEKFAVYHGNDIVGIELNDGLEDETDYEPEDGDFGDGREEEEEGIEGRRGGKKEKEKEKEEQEQGGVVVMNGELKVKCRNCNELISAMEIDEHSSICISNFERETRRRSTFVNERSSAQPEERKTGFALFDFFLGESEPSEQSSRGKVFLLFFPPLLSFSFFLSFSLFSFLFSFSLPFFSSFLSF